MSALGQKQPLSMLQILAPERLLSPLEFSASFADVRYSRKRPFRCLEINEIEGPLSANSGHRRAVQIDIQPGNFLGSILGPTHLQSLPLLTLPLATRFATHIRRSALLP
jgi:hypothetical protein